MKAVSSWAWLGLLGLLLGFVAGLDVVHAEPPWPNIPKGCANPPVCKWMINTDWGECVADSGDGCGKGIISREVRCSCNGIDTWEHNCDMRAKPEYGRACQATKGCPAGGKCAWKYAAWSTCGKDCTRTRTASCVCGTTTSSDDKCKALPKDPLSESCTGDKCPPPPTCAWSYSTWSSCSKSCTQTRTASCLCGTTPSSDYKCKGDKEPLSRDCTGDKCPPPKEKCEWVYDEWSTCPACGKDETRTRTAQCCKSDDLNPTFGKPRRTDCAGKCEGEPVLEEPCPGLKPCKPQCEWHMPDDWTDCPKCGPGNRTRTATCCKSDELRPQFGRGRPVPCDGQCEGEAPVETETCKKQKSCPCEWNYGDWTACPKCGPGGFRTRTASCCNSADLHPWFGKGKPVPCDGQCDGEPVVKDKCKDNANKCK